MELYSVLSASLDGMGFWGRMDTCVYMAESLRCSPEMTTTLLINYTPIQNKKLKVWKKKKIVWYSVSPQELFSIIMDVSKTLSVTVMISVEETAPGSS